MQNPQTEIIGTYITTLRKDFSNGYTVFYISCKNFDEYKINGKILCAGRMPITTKGVPLKLTGYFEKTASEVYLFNISDFSDEKIIEYENFEFIDINLNNNLIYTYNKNQNFNVRIGFFD
mgnify:CR=1 FL=1